jgi:hypothetical protein
MGDQYRKLLADRLIKPKQPIGCVHESGDAFAYQLGHLLPGLISCEIPVIVLDDLISHLHGRGGPMVTSLQDAPPFDSFWMEMQIPKTFWRDESLPQITIGFWILYVPQRHLDELFEDLSPIERVNSNWAWRKALKIGKGYLRSMLFVSAHDRIGCEAILNILPQGTGEAAVVPSPETDTVLKQSGNPGQQFDIYLKWSAITIYAINIMQCRNVVIAEHKPPEKLSKIHKKKTGCFLLKYKTIMVDSTKPLVKSENPSRASGNNTPMPFHLVRGHLKHYSQDKPLFGKVSGNFWWHQFGRGDMDRGKIIKTYRVKK